MLILERKIGERVRIGHDITITLIDVKGNRAKFGIDAPEEVEVHREEIYTRIQLERGA